jgi:CRISPR-associated protein Cas6
VEPFVDVAFPLRGKTLPLDHGYKLFSAVSAVVPAIHAESAWGVFPVHGERAGRGLLRLLPSSSLTIRMAPSRISEVLRLTGHPLLVDGHEVVPAVPRVFPLQPRPTLQSRFVTIKKFHGDPTEFSAAVRRQLDLLDVNPSVTVAVGQRRVIKVASHTIVGFAVGLDGLSPAESTLVQTRGIGGRRHMGAGLFLPLGRRA